MSDITLIARCHCSFASFTYTIPRSALPLKASLCHCNSCRSASGQIFATFAVMPPGTPRPDFSHLQSYASSKSLTRYSCPECGAYVGNIEADEWEFATGMLTSTEGLLDRVQMWIEDTKDGGASIWLKPGHGTNPLRHLRDRESPEATDAIIEDMSRKSRSHHPTTSSPPPSSSPPTSSSSSLNASCHCGAIKFSLHPPNPPHSSSSSPPPPPPPPPPYPAFLDACTSCRLTSGFEITSWIRAPQSHLFTSTPDQTPSTPTPTPNPIPFHIPTHPALTHYSSSRGVHRYSCRRCTASAFYINDRGGGDSVDIAMGLVRAGVGTDGGGGGGGGSRAEGWVRWTRGPEFAGDAVDGGEEGVVGAMVEGMAGLEVG